MHYYWAPDGKHILYLHDNNGDEIDHLFSADLTSGNVRDLTPFRGVRAQNVLTDSRHPGSLLVALNLRDRDAFDMYRVDVETGAITLEATNPGDVLTGRRTTISSSAPRRLSKGKPVARSSGCASGG